jgi:hypothetical protein
MTEPTAFEIKCYEEAAGIPWPDLSHIKAVFKAPDVVEKRSCVRCSKPVEGDRCDHCRAHQNTYGGAL